MVIQHPLDPLAANNSIHMMYLSSTAKVIKFSFHQLNERLVLTQKMAKSIRDGHWLSDEYMEQAQDLLKKVSSYQWASITTCVRMMDLFSSRLKVFTELLIVLNCYLYYE